MLTLAALVSAMDLKVIAGQALERPVSWVHTTEDVDPGPWVGSDEVVLTTGAMLRDAALQERWIGLLAEADAAAVGFGVGVAHPAVPDAMVAEARRLGLALFEVPYEMPFSAITERVLAGRMGDHGEEDAEATRVVGKIGKALLEGVGTEAVLELLADHLQARVSVLDDSRRPLWTATPSSTGDRGPERTRFAARPIAVERGGREERWWLEIRGPGPGLSYGNGVVAAAGARAIELELERTRRADEVGRAISRTALAGLISGGAAAVPASMALRELESSGPVSLVLVAGPPEAAGDDALARQVGTLLERELPALPVVSLFADGEAALAGRAWPIAAAAVPESESEHLGEAIDRLRRELPVHSRLIAVSRPRPLALLRQAYDEAVWALQAALGRAERFDDFSPTQRPATARDIGSVDFLLSQLDDEVFDRLGRRASEPLRAVRNGSTMRHTAEEFLRLHGSWQQSADALGCHRHTLRYRIRRIEELYGCSFDEAGDRVDMWLGLRAWQASEDWDQIA